MGQSKQPMTKWEMGAFEDRGSINMLQLHGIMGVHPSGRGFVLLLLMSKL